MVCVGENVWGLHQGPSMERAVDAGRSEGMFQKSRSGFAAGGLIGAAVSDFQVYPVPIVLDSTHILDTGS